MVLLLLAGHSVFILIITMHMRSFQRFRNTERTLPTELRTVQTIV